MKYMVAVSGGVDSVVLLDMLVQTGEHELVVAHFDHGIRADSAADARFVRALADRYGLECETIREELGTLASEEQARSRRYLFLKSTAQKHDSALTTAHHGDDIVETIAINVKRGTGWRGLAVMNDASIYRPLLGYTKGQLYKYALAHELEWVEDDTNATDDYLRNRIRHRTNLLSDVTKQRLVKLRRDQCELARHIDDEVRQFGTQSRYHMTMIDEGCALEILRAQLDEKSASLTRPQRKRLLHAIKTARAGSVYEAGSGITAHFTTRDFIVKHPL